MHLSEKDFFSREKKIALKKLFAIYYTLGGFPEVLKQNDASMNEQYFKDIVYRDILARHKIRNTKELKELCLYLISNVSTTQSYESLRKAIHATSINTIKNYVEILEDVFLLYKVPLFDYSVR